jgi:hypothetical protein
MPTATIHVHINTFTPGGCCGIDRHTIRPDDGGNRVHFKSNDPKNPHFNTLIMKSRGRSPLDVTFVVTPVGEYRANSISFVQTNGTDDPTGTANFTKPSPNGHMITVTNVFAHAGRGENAPHWEFTIGVTQNSSGLSGIIDPGIENTEQEN